ncbi:MAG TPA: DUF4330 domain-containing protein [Candidatus Aquicultor sp.]|jgi:hypothetical protein
MAVIDEKGRVFGRINLIDFTLIIGIVVIAVAVAVFATKSGKVVSIPENNTVDYTVIVKGIRPDVAGYIKVGDLAKKQMTQNPIGTVKKVVLKPAQEVIDTADGKKVLAVSPVEKDAYITIETKGRAGSDLISTGNEVLRVGDRFNLVTKWFLGDSVIIGMSVQGDQK